MRSSFDDGKYLRKVELNILYTVVPLISAHAQENDRGLSAVEETSQLTACKLVTVVVHITQPVIHMNKSESFTDNCHENTVFFKNRTIPFANN